MLPPDTLAPERVKNDAVLLLGHEPTESLTLCLTTLDEMKIRDLVSASVQPDE